MNRIPALDLPAVCSNFKSESKSDGKHAGSSYESREITSDSNEFRYILPLFNENLTSHLVTQVEGNSINQKYQGKESGLSLSQHSKVKSILDSVKDLTPVEKLFLYLQLSFNCNESTCNLLNSKEDQTQAFQWIRNNLEETDSTVNIPKHQVYEKYKLYSEQNGTTHYLAAPDFGKIVKCIFPNIKARRLGTRGNSKYCYNGLTIKENKINNCSFDRFNETSSDQTVAAACVVICEWANKLLGHAFSTIVELAKYLITGSYVSTKSLSAFIVMSASNEQIANINKRFNMTSVMGIRSMERSKVSNDASQKICDTVQVVPHTQKKTVNDRSSTQICIPLEGFTIDASSPVLCGDVSNIFTQPQEQLALKNANTDATSLKHQPCLYTLQKNDGCFTSSDIKTFVPFSSNTTPKKFGRQKSVKKNSPYVTLHSSVSPSLKQILETTQNAISSSGQNFRYGSFPTQSSYSDTSPSEIEFHTIFSDEFSTRNQFYSAQRCQSVPSMSRTNVNAHQPLTPQYISSKDLFSKPAQMKARRNLSSLFNESSILNDDISQFASKIKVQDDDNLNFITHFEKTNELNVMKNAQCELEYQINRQPANVLNIDLNELSTPDELSDLAYNFEDIEGQELLNSF